MRYRYLLLSLAAFFSAPAAHALNVQLNVQLSVGPAVTVVGGFSQITLASTFGITNVGTRSLTLGLARHIVQEVPGSENNFCFGAGCYPPTVSVSPQPISLAVGATDNSFIGDYTPNGIAGITIIRYAVYDVNGAGSAADTAYVTVTYDASQRVAGRANDLASSQLLTAPAPNPAPAGTDVAVTVAADAPRGASLRLVDLRDGRTVRTVSLAAQPFCVIVAAPALAGTDDSGSGQVSGSGQAGSYSGQGGCGGCGSTTYGIAPGGCYLPPTAPATATVVRVSTAGLAAGVYGCQLVDRNGQARAMRRLVVQ